MLHSSKLTVNRAVAEAGRVELQVEILDIGRVRESGSDTQGRHEFKRTNKVHTQATIIIKVFTTRDLPRP